MLSSALTVPTILSGLQPGKQAFTGPGLAVGDAVFPIEVRDGVQDTVPAAPRIVHCTPSRKLAALGEPVGKE